jgi:ribosomal protein S8
MYEDAGLEDLNTTDSGLVLIYNREPKKVGLYKYADNWFGLSPLNKNLTDKENLVFNKDTLLGDSQTIYSIINELPKKHYSVSKTPETKKSTFNYTLYKPAYLSDSIPQIFIISNQLIANYRSIDNVIQTKDSINIGVTSTKNNNQIRILFPVKPKGRILFPININNAEGKTIRDTIKTTIPEYTELLLTNKEKETITVVLTHKNTTETYIQSIESGKNLALWALAGEQTLELWIDTDQDKHITAPDFASKRKGERYKKHKSIVLKDGMSLEIGLNMGISE